MASTPSETLDWLVTTLRGIDGTGSYYNDLSAAGKVVVGAVPKRSELTTDLPQLWITDLTHATSGEAAQGATLTSLARQMKVKIIALTSSSDGQPLSLRKAGWDLAADIDKALTADRSPAMPNGTRFRDIVPQSDADLGVSYGFDGLARVDVEVDITYQGAL